MSNEEERKISESLDPRQYIEHVTRTSILLEQLAHDVKALRDQSVVGKQELDELRRVIAEIKTDVAVYKEASSARHRVIEDQVQKGAEQLRWLGRLLVGTVITGILSGVLALVFHSLGK